MPETKAMEYEHLDASLAYADERLLPEAEFDSFAGSKAQRNSSISIQKQISGLIVAFILGLATLRIYQVFQQTKMPDDYARVESFAPPTVYKPLFWWTEYSDANDTAVDAMWDAMNPDHGLIAMDREWAKNQHWPDSMRWPIDPSKNIYVLEGYHLLHCLTIIRKSFWEAVRDQPTDYSQYTYDPSHTGHCLDALRQHVICDANPTPLFSFMDTVVGDKQPRKCRDWNALRDFATKNSACFQNSHHSAHTNETEHPSVREQFSHCPTSSDDGIKVDAERRGNWD